jgi:antimicrobial peptide system SdpA family protein
MNTKVVVFLGLLASVFGAAFFSVLPSTSFNPLKFSYRYSSLIYTLLPQGWGFFTRDPREAQTMVYRPEGSAFRLVNKSNGEASYLFGLSRVSRRQNIELGQIIATIPSQAWTPCSSRNLSSCLSDSLVVRKNPFKSPLIKGEYVLVSTNPIPWAWSHSRKPVVMPFKTVRLYVVSSL